MADVATNYGVWQVQAYDGRISRVRIINEGANKRGFRFSAGAYVTLLDSCQSNWIEAIGQSTSNGVTTLTILNHDGNNVSLAYTGIIKIVGGAFQGSGTRFKIRFTASCQIETDIEGTGVAYDVDSSVNGLWTKSEMQGFSGTYMVGASAPAQMLLDQQVNYNIYPFNLDFGHFNLNNQGMAGISSLNSGALGQYYYLQVGRTGLDLLLGVAGAANDLVSGTVSGDAVVASWGSGSTLYLGGAATPNAHVNSTGFYTAGTGTIRQGIVLVQPSSDTDVFTVRTTAGVVKFDINTSNGITALASGGNLIGYSDVFATQQFNLSATNGTLVLAGYLSIGATQVVGPRQTGWTAGSGTANKGAFAAYAGQTLGAAYSQSAAQATDNAAMANAQRILAIEQALRNHGLIN
ncbi:MAG: hypothetical protein JOZ27_07690 [Caulobacteraceae bacterium]|nr:hypothetical protein [Caulobacteraceae bacterium]